MVDLYGGPERLIVVHAPSQPDLVGRTLAEVAAARGTTPLQQLIDFAMAGSDSLPHGVLVRPIAGHSFDVENYMRQEFTATSTDGGVSLRTRPGQHPRYYGTYPRKIAHYVKERHVIGLPFAARSSSGLPAQIIGLPDRGYIREGYKADLVLFDFERIRDRATILQPDRYPVGIEYVLVNGEFTVDGATLTGKLPGRVLDRGEAKTADAGRRISRH
jgi:N-acyl-D-amino-acid deacylase